MPRAAIGSSPTARASRYRPTKSCKEVSNMPSGEKRQPKIACTCGACQLALADGKATLHMLCGCEDCRQALQWGYKTEAPNPHLYLVFITCDRILSTLKAGIKW